MVLAVFNGELRQPGIQAFQENACLTDELAGDTTTSFTQTCEDAEKRDGNKQHPARSNSSKLQHHQRRAYLEQVS
ncbi:hypothetical protein T265_04751 [Opisthorchis viverrini]|uniref:Uncharacterized protein n=1 Tax=Opisthorchis viverrini TaxID=6198 RepID=A0A074ZRJ0_OPIVI|nr:hypothetical protein T265_04751 [Opisthorchis viverrini]KER28447.1 hypothetical protein T265_04751 [Opisthorchis viverrini]